MRVVVMVLVALMLTSCATTQSARNLPVQSWQRDTRYGEVRVRQLRSDAGVCLWREVTMHRRVGLYIDGRPTFVRAIDYGCDDRFDSWHFRSTLERERADVRDLEVLLLHLMYEVLPISEHPTAY